MESLIQRSGCQQTCHVSRTSNELDLLPCN
jgi:hypothetical protein